jgi:hypothetical protein
MIDGIPVIDAVVHAYNWAPENYANRYGAILAQQVYHATHAAAAPGYRLPQDTWIRDWSVEEISNVSFVESDTDIAVHHALQIGAYKDGSCSLEKALEAKQRWPHRTVVYAGVDPLTGKLALDELDRQVELLNPVGVKLYPNTFIADQVHGWRMDDPEVAFPVFERAQKLGLKVVAIHKAVPMGPVPMDVYKVDDIDRAAIAFPDLNFEIVHGGSAFVEETAWQLARFQNVWVNLEITSAMLIHAPGQFHDAMFNLMRVGQEHALRRIMWGTGCMAIHPRPALERFVREFGFNDDTVERGGIRQITEADKRRILAGNYAEMVGLDLGSRLAGIRNDEFAKRRGAGAPADPYSTTASAGRAE